MKPAHCLVALAAAGLALAATATAPAAPANVTSPARLRELLVAANFEEALKLAKPAARWPDHANGSEGSLQTNTPILLDWDLCVTRGGTNGANAPRPAGANFAREGSGVRGIPPLSKLVVAPIAPRPHISRYPWLEFVPASNGLAAEVHSQVDSYPRTAWKIRLQQVDRFGDFVVVHHKHEQVIENSGTIQKIPHFENITAAFPPSGGARGSLYQISIETVWTEQGNPVRWDEPMPLTLDLPTAERSLVFRAESLALQKTNGSVQASVLAGVVSWPKSRWRLALRLSDSQGNEAGRAEHIVENLGVVLGDALHSWETFQFAIPGELQLLATAHRWTLRIEALPRDPAK